MVIPLSYLGGHQKFVVVCAGGMGRLFREADESKIGGEESIG